MDVINDLKDSIIRRGIAKYIDCLLLGGIAVAIIYGLGGFDLNNIECFPLILSGSLICTLMLSVCKDCVNGRSFGSWATGIGVRDYKDPCLVPNIKRLIFRNVFKSLYPFEFFFLLFSKEARCYGERKTETQVIVVRKIGLLKESFIGIILVLSFFVFLLLGITQLFKHSDAYATSINYIEHNQEIMSITNGIQGYGWFPQGSLELMNADFEIEVIGKNKNVITEVELVKNSKNTWVIKRIQYKEEVKKTEN